MSRVPETSSEAQALVAETTADRQHSADGTRQWWSRVVERPQGAERWIVVRSPEGGGPGTGHRAAPGGARPGDRGEALVAFGQSALCLQGRCGGRPGQDLPAAARLDPGRGDGGQPAPLWGAGASPQGCHARCSGLAPASDGHPRGRGPRARSAAPPLSSGPTSSTSKPGPMTPSSPATAPNRRPSAGLPFSKTPSFWPPRWS